MTWLMTKGNCIQFHFARLQDNVISTHQPCANIYFFFLNRSPTGVNRYARAYKLEFHVVMASLKFES